MNNHCSMTPQTKIKAYQSNIIDIINIDKATIANKPSCSPPLCFVAEVQDFMISESLGALDGLPVLPTESTSRVQVSAKAGN